MAEISIAQYENDVALRWRFSVDEYFRLGEIGFFDPDERVELIDGEIYRMPPQGPEHADAVSGIGYLFQQRLFEKGPTLAWLRIAMPLVIPGFDAMEPDVALVKERPGPDRHPGPEDVLLLVEVSRSTLWRDRKLKLARYATAGIPEYWILNLADPGRKTLEVYRNPLGEEYETKRTLRAGDEIDVLCVPGLGAFAVVDLLG